MLSTRSIAKLHLPHHRTFYLLPVSGHQSKLFLTVISAGHKCYPGHFRPRAPAPSAPSRPATEPGVGGAGVPAGNGAQLHVKRPTRWPTPLPQAQQTSQTLCQVGEAHAEAARPLSRDV